MSTLAEIEKAVPQLTASELAELERFIRQTRESKEQGGPRPPRELPVVAATGRAITQEQIDAALDAD